MPLTPKQQPPYYTEDTLQQQPKRYVALLTQTGTNAPTATILENTLDGTPIWTRQFQGYYRATLTGQFPQNKTVAKPFGATTSTAAFFIGIGNATPLEYTYTITNASNDYIEVEIYKASDYSPEDLGTICSSGQKLLVEITIYP